MVRVVTIGAAYELAQHGDPVEAKQRPVVDRSCVVSSRPAELQGVANPELQPAPARLQLHTLLGGATKVRVRA